MLMMFLSSMVKSDDEGCAKASAAENPSAAAPSAPEQEYYEYETAGAEYPGETGRGTRRGIGGRPLPLPPLPTLEPPIPGQGQSRSQWETGNETRGHRHHALSELDERGNGHSDAFILRHLFSFKGEYNGKSITDWLQKVDLLRKITNIHDDDLLPLLFLRVDTNVIPFLEGVRDRLSPLQYTWNRVKQALLEQYGGVTNPTIQVNRLHSARMGRDTPVRKFAYEIERLTRLAYPELASDVGSPEQRDTQKNILNRIALEQFISGLSAMLSRPIVERQINDFEEAVRVAAHMEEVNARYFRKSTINAMFNDLGDHCGNAGQASYDSSDRSDNHQSRFQPGRGRGGARNQGRGGRGCLMASSTE